MVYGFLSVAAGKRRLEFGVMLLLPRKHIHDRVSDANGTMGAAQTRT
jgi:hypothetical protein